MTSSFSRGPGYILFHSDTPGGHAAIIGPDGSSLMPLEQHNSFNDGAKKYTWGFLWFMPFVEGMRFTFAVVEYDVTAVVAGDDFKLVDLEGMVVEREPLSMRPVRLVPKVTYVPVAKVKIDESGKMSIVESKVELKS